MSVGIKRAAMEYQDVSGGTDTSQRLMPANDRQHNDLDQIAEKVRESIESLAGNVQFPFAEMCHMHGVSLSTLSRAFQRRFGVPVREYCIERRMLHARRLLEEHPSMLEGVVSRRLGYAESTSFQVAFRRRFGMSPGEYRKRFNSRVALSSTFDNGAR